MDSQVDVRPKFVLRNDDWLLMGAKCQQCDYRLAVAGPWCPLCHGAIADTEFGPGGTVWSSTILRVTVGGHAPPRALAYVDIDDGPRVICEVADVPESAPAIGSRVTLGGPSPDGDPIVRPQR